MTQLVILVVAEQRDGALNRATLGSGGRARSSWPAASRRSRRRARAGGDAAAQRARRGGRRRGARRSSMPALALVHAGRATWPRVRAVDRRRRRRRSCVLAAHLSDARLRADAGGAPARAAGHRRHRHRRAAARPPRSCGRCSRASWSPRCGRAATAPVVRHAARSARSAPTPSATRRRRRRCSAVDVDHRRRGDPPDAGAAVPGSAGRPSISARPSASWPWAAASSRRSTSPVAEKLADGAWAPSSPRRGRSATTAGCRWSARSAARARPWRRSSTSRSASPAPSSTWSA